MGNKHSKQPALDAARDELFSHIQRCGVLDAEDDERKVWMKDTVEYLAERYPDLSKTDLDELNAIGHRYCQPAIAYGNNDTPEPEVAD